MPGSSGGFSVLQSLQSAFTTLVGYLPQFLGALLVLVIGWLVAKVLRGVITKLLQKAKLDQRLTHGSGGEYVARFSPQGSPAALVGTVVYVVIMLFVVVTAIGTLGIPALTGFMDLALSYLPNVIAALLIFLVGAAVAAAVGGLAHRAMGDTPTGRVVRAAAPLLVMAIAVFMMLNQLGIAPVIVTTTYIALIGSIALGAALAFGLGGREAAAALIDSGYRRAQQESAGVREDLAVGRERARADYEARAGRREDPTAAVSATEATPARGVPAAAGTAGNGNGNGHHEAR